MNPNGAACILSATIPLSIASIKVTKNKIEKAVLIFAMIIIVAALYATQSRSGLIAGILGIVFLLARPGQRGLAIILIFLILAVGIVFSDARESFRERIVNVYSSKSETYDRNIMGRLDTWKSYFYTATPSIYVFGQGFDQGVKRNGMESHNAFISLITVYGAFSVMWFILLSTRILYINSKVKNLQQGSVLRTAINGGLIAFLIWCIYGLASDSISSQYPRYVLFFSVVVTDKIYYLISAENHIKEEQIGCQRTLQFAIHK